MTQRERVSAYLEMARAQGARDEIRMAFGDEDAVELAEELLAAKAPLNQRLKLVDGVDVLATALNRPKPANISDTVAIMEYARGLQSAVSAFWDAFEGQEVDGVTVIRRRA